MCVWGRGHGTQWLSDRSFYPHLFENCSPSSLSHLCYSDSPLPPLFIVSYLQQDLSKSEIP